MYVFACACTHTCMSVVKNSLMWKQVVNIFDSLSCCMAGVGWTETEKNCVLTCKGGLFRGKTRDDVYHHFQSSYPTIL